jgi:hypothetical protein
MAIPEAGAAMAEDMKSWEGPALDAWRGAWTPEEAAAALAGCEARWCVVGGWAIDLAAGRTTREHEDLEVAIPRADFAAAQRHLEQRGLELYEVGDGQTRRLASGEPPRPDRHQNWVCDPATQSWRMDLMLEPTQPPVWRTRRHPDLEPPWDFMIAPGPIPHLRPHGVLLYKAKSLRPTDLADRATAMPLMGLDERDWLIGALELVHPGHAWIETLRQTQ